MNLDEVQTSVSVIIPCYNDAGRAINLVYALQAQRLPDNVSMEIIVVDDGSGDECVDRLNASLNSLALVHSAKANMGRASARTMGAEIAGGTYLLFIDCDCLPLNDVVVATHLRAIQSEGAIASSGDVVGSGSGFWHKFQAEASRRRREQHASGLQFSGSSQNFMVSRAAFQAVGGFSSAYKGYGFEDRDLQLRLLEFGSIAWADGAVVRHMDELNVPLVASKMQAAGGESGELFSRTHPNAYRSLGYSRIDARIHLLLRIPGSIFCKHLFSVARTGDRLIRVRILPYWLSRLLVRVISAAAYLTGTCRTERLG